jgi:hypothetical protein
MITLCVGIDKTFLVPKGYLMAISPVFKGMFSTEMDEKNKDKIDVKGTNSPEDFHAFLEAISHKQIHPNRKLLR